MFNFIKHATGFMINAASFGFVNFGRSKPWYVKVGFVALGLCLNLLINSVFHELGDAVEGRLNEVSDLHGRITGYVGDQSPK